MVAAGKDTKKETKLGLSAKKATDFGEWYSQVVVESEMISYYDVSGAGKQHSLRCRKVVSVLLLLPSYVPGRIDVGRSKSAPCDEAQLLRGRL
jgi:hypothetical protein